jgi:hypothetical protein
MLKASAAGSYISDRGGITRHDLQNPALSDGTSNTIVTIHPPQKDRSEVYDFVMLDAMEQLSFDLQILFDQKNPIIDMDWISRSRVGSCRPRI